MPCLCRVPFTRVMHPLTPAARGFRLSSRADLLSSCAWKKEDSQSLGSLLPLHIIFLHSPLTFFLRLSDPRCLLLSPEIPLRTDLTSSAASMQSVYLVNFALQKHAESGQRCDFAVQLCFLSGCEPRQELWTGLPLSRHRTRFVFPCKRIIQLCSYLTHNS